MRWTRALIAGTLALAAGVTTRASAAHSSPAQTPPPLRWEGRLQQELGLSAPQAQALPEADPRGAPPKRQHPQPPEVTWPILRVSSFFALSPPLCSPPPFCWPEASPICCSPFQHCRRSTIQRYRS